MYVCTDKAVEESQRLETRSSLPFNSLATYILLLYYIHILVCVFAYSHINTYIHTVNDKA